MARLKYAELGSAELAPLVARIRSERGDVLYLYRMLLHSPPVAEGWLHLMTAIRKRTVISGTLREMIIIRIAHLNGAPYEAEQHTPFARREGVTDAQIAALAEPCLDASIFAADEQVALGLTDTITKSTSVNSGDWEAARAQWNDRELVELVATIASYNMVSRFLAALEITSSDAAHEPNGRP